MPNFVTIELSQDSLLVACAKSAGRRFHITNLFQVQLASEESDKQIGEKLKKALSENGVPRGEIIAVVDRHEVEIREVSVPPAPDNELPELVRFQARNIFASMNESWQLDFVPFKEKEVESGQTRVLAIAISPKVKDKYEAIAESAGLKLKRIVFRPYVFCSLLESRLDDSKNRLLIHAAGDRFDFSVTTGPDLLATRTVKKIVGSEIADVVKQIVSEIRRTIASTRSSLSGGDIEQIIIGANRSDCANLEDVISAELAIPVVFSSPYQSLDRATLIAPVPDGPEQYSGVIGALTCEYSAKKQAVDFLNPRKPVVKKTNYQSALIAAGVVAACLFAAAGYGWFVLGQQNKIIAEKQQLLKVERQKNKGDSIRPGLDQIIAEVNKLDEWQATDVNWLDELSKISERLLSPDEIIVGGFSGTQKREDGFQISLSIQTTEETSSTTDWKNKFYECYDTVNLGDTKGDAENPDYPISQSILLSSKSDLTETVQKISEAAQRQLDQEMAAEQGRTEETPEQDPATDS